MSGCWCWPGRSRVSPSPLPRMPPRKSASAYRGSASWSSAMQRPRRRRARRSSPSPIASTVSRRRGASACNRWTENSPLSMMPCASAVRPNVWLRSCDARQRRSKDGQRHRCARLRRPRVRRRHRPRRHDALPKRPSRNTRRPLPRPRSLLRSARLRPCCAPTRQRPTGGRLRREINSGLRSAHRQSRYPRHLRRQPAARLAQRSSISTRSSASDRLSPPPRARWRALDTSISLASRGGSVCTIAPSSLGVK